MKICNDCKFPLLSTMCVNGYEMLCFNCGGCYEFLNGCERVEATKELLIKEKEMEKVKTKVYSFGFKTYPDGRTNIGISPDELLNRIKRKANK